MQRETITKVWLFPCLPTPAHIHLRRCNRTRCRWGGSLEGGGGSRRARAPGPVAPCHCCSARAMLVPMLRHTQRLGWAQRGPPPDSCRGGRRRVQAIVVGLTAVPRHAAIPSTVHVVTTIASERYASRTWREGAKSYFRDCLSPFSFGYNKIMPRVSSS